MSLQCKFSGFFANMCATFCEILKIEGKNLKIASPFLFEKRKHEHYHFNQLPIAGLDSNTNSKLGLMTLLFDRLFHFFNKKLGIFATCFYISVNLTNFSNFLGKFLQVFYITHFFAKLFVVMSSQLCLEHLENKGSRSVFLLRRIFAQ